MLSACVCVRVTACVRACVFIGSRGIDNKSGASI